MKKIKLTQNKYALVDDSDYDFLNQWRWCVMKAHNTFYAQRGAYIGGVRRMVRMHQVLMNTPHGKHTDHIDKNGLNNQRSNLRVVTAAENFANARMRSDNTSGFTGVTWSKRNKKWFCRFKVNKAIIYVGYFLNLDEAVRATEAAMAHHRPTICKS